MKAHFNDLERQVKPQLKEYRPSKENDFPIVRLVSIVGVIVAAGLFLPLT